jgi:hypothetical protein
VNGPTQCAEQYECVANKMEHTRLNSSSYWLVNQMLRFQVGPLCEVHVRKFKVSDETSQTAKLKSFQMSRVTAHSDRVSRGFRGSLRYSRKDKFNR